MDTEEANARQLPAMLEKVTRTSELFQRKNAEQEKINDRLRLENVQLHQTIEDLTDEVHTLKQQLSEEGKHNEQFLKKQETIYSSRGEITTSSNHVEEVKTLRRVKKELEKQLNASQSTTLSFQASFQAEFDLRAQIEQKLEELRERYERLIMENDQLRLILKAHNITAPSPPGLRSMPGSRKKKHAPKSRPMTMYSDLSEYNDPVTRSNKRATKIKSSQVKKAPSLGSLLDGNVKNTTSANSKSSAIDSKVSATVMAETAQVEQIPPTNNNSASSKDTTRPQELGTGNELEPESLNQNDVNGSSTEHTQNGKHGDELLPPLACSRTDTLMWNAKGFLSRIEKLADSGESGDRKEGEDNSGEKPATNERDENELKEMMSASVSVKQLENAKAFLEASQRYSPECPEHL